MAEIKMLMADNYFIKWEVVKIESTRQYGIVVEQDATVLPFNTTFTIKTLNISKWWLIRKIQLWGIKKAFKQDITCKEDQS